MTLPDDWAGMSVEERRTIARAALTRVEVRKGRLSVPLEERITVTFAD